MVIVSKNIIRIMHCFTISTCESVPPFNDSLRTQVNEMKE